jgi:hypothetical protein
VWQVEGVSVPVQHRCLVRAQRRDDGVLALRRQHQWRPTQLLGTGKDAGAQDTSQHLRPEADAQDRTACREATLEEPQLIRDPWVAMRFVHGNRAAETDHELRRRDIDVAQILPAGLDITDLETALPQDAREGAAVFEVNVPEGKREAGRLHSASLLEGTTYTRGVCGTPPASA